MDVVTGLGAWFTAKLQGLQYLPETTAYVVGVLKARERVQPADDFSDRSVTLAFRDAVMSGDFVQFQRLGDWILWAEVMVPEHFAENRAVISNIGSLSYYSCHRILRGQWRVYEELAEKLPVLTQHVRAKLTT